MNNEQRDPVKAANINIPMTAGQLAKMMAGLKVRERMRIIEMLRRFGHHEAADLVEKDGASPVGVYAVPVVENPEPEPEPEPVDDPLPPVRHMDDFEEGMSMLRSRSTFGRGGLID
jgi:hypothetical protein